MGNVAKDPFKVVMRKSHLPITLLQEKVSFLLYLSNSSIYLHQQLIILLYLNVYIISHSSFSSSSSQAKFVRPHILETETFASVFGPKSTRKRPNIRGLEDLDQMRDSASTKTESYSVENDRDIVRDNGGVRDQKGEHMVRAGGEIAFCSRLLELEETEL